MISEKAEEIASYAVFFLPVLYIVCKRYYCASQMDPPALKDISEEDVIVSARKRYNTQSPLFKQGQFSAYGHQVAGHTKEGIFVGHGNYNCDLSADTLSLTIVAILKYDKKILKPMIKRDLFLRELA